MTWQEATWLPYIGQWMPVIAIVGMVNTLLFIFLCFYFMMRGGE